jgi:hypothetical protein
MIILEPRHIFSLLTKLIVMSQQKMVNTSLKLTLMKGFLTLFHAVVSLSQIIIIHNAFIYNDVMTRSQAISFLDYIFYIRLFARILYETLAKICLLTIINNNLFISYMAEVTILTINGVVILNVGCTYRSISLG